MALSCLLLPEVTIVSAHKGDVVEKHGIVKGVQLLQGSVVVGQIVWQGHVSEFDVLELFKESKLIC